MIGVDIREQANRISGLKNPFFADKVIQFSTFATLSSFSGWSYHGSIKFRNGDTEGEQKFTGSDFGSLLKRMEVFMTDLDGQK